MGRLTYILNAQPNIDDRDAKVPADKEVRGEIEFRDLTFTYPTMLSGDGNAGVAASNGTSAIKAPPSKAISGNGTGASANSSHPILSNINLRIPAGSTLAIIGPTGSGKTTLAALVARLWEAPAGRIADRWTADTRVAFGNIAACHRLCAARHLFVRGYAGRKYRLWPAAIRCRTRARSRRSCEPRRRHRGFHGKIRDGRR